MSDNNAVRRGISEQYIIKKKDAEIIRFDDPPRTAFIWGVESVGAKHMSFGTCEIDVGGSNIFHTHDNEEEVMFIYEGKGVARIEDEEFPIDEETYVFVPKGVKHQFKNTGDTLLKFVWAASPQGIEERLRRRYK